MKKAPWIGPAISTPSSVALSTHLRNIPTSSAAQLKASATASARKVLTTAVFEGSFMGLSEFGHGGARGRAVAVSGGVPGCAPASDVLVAGGQCETPRFPA